jgi:outer membrane protein OmpA-like peptidoglycan-associated protein
MGSKFDGTFGCTAELFLGSKSLEKLQVSAQGKMKPIDPGEYRMVMTVDAKAKLKLGPGLEFEETFEVTWKVVVADDGSLSFDDRKTGKLKHEYLVGGMTLDKYEAGGDKARMGVEIEIEGETQRRDFEVTLKGNPAASKAPKKVVKFPAILNVGSFPTNVFEVKKIKVKPAGYTDWAGLKKFYDDLPSLTRQKIENGEKPGDQKIEILGFADDTGNAADNSKLGEKRAADVMGWFKTWSGSRSESIYLTKGVGSGTASKGKDDPKKRWVMISLVCEKEA